MKEELYEKIVNCLTSILSDNDPKCMKLNIVPDRLSRISVDRSEYNSVGLKKWLSDQFSDQFILLGSNGFESIWLASDSEAKSLAKIESAIQDRLNAGDTILLSALPDYLHRICGKDCSVFARGMSIFQWLTSRLGQFEKGGEGNRYLVSKGTAPAPAPSSSPILMPAETQQMHAIAYMNMWSSNGKLLRQYESLSAISDNMLRDTIAKEMARSLLDPSNGLVLALEEDPPRIAFPTGLEVQGETLYSILGPNPKNSNRNVQFWALQAFCCPGDQRDDGLGLWLKEHLSSEKGSDSFADPAKLRETIQQIRCARDELQEQLDAYRSALEQEVEPTGDLAAYLGAYQILWDRLKGQLKGRFLLENVAKRISLPELEGHLDKEIGLRELFDQAVKLFGEIVDGVNKIYTVHKIIAPEKGTPNKDYDRIQKLCRAPSTAENFEEFRNIAQCYHDLRAVMRSPWIYDVMQQAGAVSEHFTELPTQMIQLLLGIDPQEYGCLSKLEQLDILLDRCIQDTRNIKAPEAETLDIGLESLFQRSLLSKNEQARLWIRQIGAILQHDERQKALVLNDKSSLCKLLTSNELQMLETVSRDLTPYGAGCRIYAVEGRKDDLAEKYFLLGTLYDTARCVPALLDLYRQSGQQECFQKIFDGFHDRVTYRDKDQLYALLLQCTDQPGALSLEQLEKYLAANPSLLKNKDVMQDVVLHLANLQQDRPAAFWAWINQSLGEMNNLEKAIANNALENIRSYLVVPSLAETLGYTSEEIDRIHHALTQGLPIGGDAYSQAMRLLLTQGNKKRTAERLLWNASNDSRAIMELFDLYYKDSDFSSVCWIVQRLKPQLEERSRQTKAYLESLVQIQDRDALVKFVEKHPFLWYSDGVLALLAPIGLSFEKNAPLWLELQQWHIKHPFLPASPFETAVVAGNLAAARSYLSYPEQMEDWGYPPQMQDRARKALEDPALPWDQAERSVFERIDAIQGNLHRFLEKFLYDCINCPPKQLYQQLFDLMYAEGRYMEAAAYFEAYSDLRTSERNNIKYLWSLLQLEREDQALKLVSEHPEWLQYDSELKDRACALARQKDPALAERLGRIFSLLPCDLLEKYVISGETFNLSRLVSDPSQLTNMGYSREKIAYFKECLIKPYPKANDGYAVGARVRIFLGDERAEPFLLNSENDPRSAHALFDVYTNQKRWDDLCMLYQRHESEEAWNDHYRKLYHLALTRALHPEINRLCVEYIDSGELPKNNSDIQWLYLRALLGAGSSVDDALDHTMIPSETVRFIQKRIEETFDLLWDQRYRDRREDALYLAEKLLRIYSSKLSLDERESLATIHGLLLQDPDRSMWADFLQRNGWDNILQLLNCRLDFTLKGDPEKAAQFCQKLCRQLDAAPVDMDLIQQLVLYSEHAAHSCAPQQAREELSQRLLVGWADLLSPEKGLDLDAWDAFSKVAGGIMLTPQQNHQVLQLWLGWVDRATDLEARRSLMICGTRILLSLDPEQAAEQSIRDLVEQLIERWVDLLSLDREMEPAVLPVFVDLWRSPLLTEDQFAHMDQVLAGWLQQIEQPTLSLFEQMSFVLKQTDPSGEGSLSAKQLVDAFICWSSRGTEVDLTGYKELAISLIGYKNLSAHQMSQIIEIMKISQLFDDEDLRGVIEQQCGQHWPDLAYSWKKYECLYFSEGEQRTLLLRQLLAIARGQLDSLTLDETDLNLLHEAVCSDLTVQNLWMLLKAYQMAENADPAKIQILQTFIEADCQEGEPDKILIWLYSVLEQHDTEWLQSYSVWWSGLVHLNEQDASTKTRVDFLGLAQSRVSREYQQSVARLLLSDLNNTRYLKCFLRISQNLSPVALSKLEYIEAIREPDRMEDIVKRLIKREQYGPAVDLLLHRMELPVNNSSTIGQLIGALYTCETLEKAPFLRDKLPGIFDGIGRMNQTDPAGVWKNLGRAVDAAFLTNCEDILLKHLGEPMFQEPGRSAAVIAHLLLKNEFSQARTWMARVRPSANNYLDLLRILLDQLPEDRALTPREELLLRSIPQDGNARSVEIYSELIQYAFSRGWKQECAIVFSELYQANAHDLALMICFIQLYMAAPETVSIYLLYDVSLRYLEVSTSDFVARAACSLMVISACLPDPSANKEDAFEHVRLRIGSLRQDNGEQLDKFRALKDNCRRFLESGGEAEHACRREILLRAATGWWRIDRTVLDQLVLLRNTQEDLLPTLAQIYPRSFVAACFRLALSFPSDVACHRTLQDLLRQCAKNEDREGIKGIDLCADRIRCVANVEPVRAAELEKLLDRPMETPVQYRYLLDTVLDNPNEDQVKAELGMLFSIRPGFSYAQYQNGIDGLMECVKQDHPQYAKLVIEQLVAMSSTSAENLGLPKTYLASGNYIMVYQAANAYLKRISNGTRNFLTDLNETFSILGQLMAGMLSEEEKKEIRLAQYLNMANLLCQSESYTDLEKMMEVCPARWKICIRCLQELIQGQPNKVLSVLRDNRFRKHVGCWNFLMYLTYMFVCGDLSNTNGRRRGQALLRTENMQMNRDSDWGTISLSNLSELYGGDLQSIRHPLLLYIENRNPQMIPPFKESLAALIDEMVREDAYEDDEKTDPENESKIVQPDKITAAFRSFKTIPYVQEQVERWLTKTSDGADPIEQDRKEMIGLLKDAVSEQRIDLCGKLLALDWRTEGDASDCWYCAELGLALYDKACEKKGIAVYATPQARRILYDMAICLPGTTIQKVMSKHIQTALSQCLSSYRDLSELTSDCSETYMENLYEAISDPKRQGSLKRHIEFVREIGNKMSVPMTNAERLNWLRGCVNRCRSERTNLNMEPTDKLIQLLNQQIFALQQLAQVMISVYNQTGPLECGCLFGKIENLGAQEVSNIQLELCIDGVLMRKYRLRFLDGKAMAPFALPYEVDEEKESLEYSILVHFYADNGSDTELQTVQTDGQLLLTEPEYVDLYPLYKVDVPADETTYVERSSLETILRSLYGDHRRFKDFPNLAIYGMRRTGKTSMLRYLERKLKSRVPEEHLYCAECSAESANGTLYERTHLVLIRQTLRELSSQSNLNGQEGWDAFCSRWEHLPPERELSRWDWLDHFFSELDMKFLHGCGLVILVDEVEKLCSLGIDLPSQDMTEDVFLNLDAPNNVGPAEDTDLWNTLSRITQRTDSPVRFVFCGSDLFANKVLEGDNLTQFFQRIKKLSIGRMTRIELEQTMRSLEKEEGSCLRFESDALEYLWRTVGGLPWHAKILVNSAIENRLIMEEGGFRQTIYPSDILERMDAILSNEKESSDNNFGLVGLSPDEEVLLSALTEKLGHASSVVPESALKQIFHTAVPEENWEERFAKACKTLLKERQLLKRDQMGFYRFGCEIYRLYNRREYPEQFVESEETV